MRTTSPPRLRPARTVAHGCTLAVALWLAACAAPATRTAPAAAAATPATLSGATHAAAACPDHVPPGTMADLTEVDSSIRVDVRYATADNFTGAPLPGYEAPRVLLRPDAAASLVRVQARLRGQGLGLLVWDGYRPVRATLAMVDWAERTGNDWVLEQGYVARRSGHNRGNTVDLTLVQLDTGEPLPMGTEYDEFSEAAHTENASGRIRENRQRLVNAMAAEGWRNYEKEWWHFSLPGDPEPLDIPLACF
jgi:zinc D-Ala-D-Ala dipeptidase